MDLSYSPEEHAFQREVRGWLARNMPKREPDERPLDFHDPRRIARGKGWQRKLYEAGYVAMGWPRDYGGQGADVMRQTIVNEEMVRARAPGLIGMMGIQMVGPTLITHGTEEQRRRHLPKILTAEDIWCQGYSEPGSGSDLASLRTRAELRSDEFVVNGQKVWTSNAQLADLAIRVETMKLEAYRQLTDTLRGRPHGISASVSKLVTTELNHDLAEAALDILGSYGPLARGNRRARDGGAWPLDFMFTLGLIIGGGTSQIQKNIIA